MVDLDGNFLACVCRHLLHMGFDDLVKFNPYLPSGLVHPYKLNESIYDFKHVIMCTSCVHIVIISTYCRYVLWSYFFLLLLRATW